MARPMTGRIILGTSATLEREKNYPDSKNKQSLYLTQLIKCNDKAVPLQAWTGPEGS